VTGDASSLDDVAVDGTDGKVGYRRSAGSARGEARRQELLDLVSVDLAANGLTDFSLRRAARAAGTTHKVLLYYFDGADDLLAQAVQRLRQRRISGGLAAASAAGVDAAGVEVAGAADGFGGASGAGSGAGTLAARVAALWPVLSQSEESAVLDQAIGLAIYDPLHFAALGREASQQYLPSLLSLCPPHWSGPRKLEVSQLILATLRGFLLDLRTSGDLDGVQAGLRALLRALDREEAQE